MRSDEKVTPVTISVTPTSKCLNHWMTTITLLELMAALIAEDRALRDTA